MVMLVAEDSGVILPPNDRPVQVFSTAIGTTPYFDVDRNSFKAIARAAKNDGYKLRSMIESLVQSDLFQNR